MGYFASSLLVITDQLNGGREKQQGIKWLMSLAFFYALELLINMASNPTRIKVMCGMYSMDLYMRDCDWQLKIEFTMSDSDTSGRLI